MAFVSRGGPARDAAAHPAESQAFFRYALLFILFPGMVLGFWMGLGITLAFCAALVAFLAMGQVEHATQGVKIWLACGGCVFVWVCCGAIRSAVALRRVRESARPAESPAAQPAPECSVEQALRWHKSEDGSRWVAELSWAAPVQGVYAALISVQEMGRRRLLTLGRQGVCTVHTATTPNGGLQALLLYHLQAGQHTLRWSLAPKSGAAPRASVTLLCRPS